MQKFTIIFLVSIFVSCFDKQTKNAEKNILQKNNEILSPFTISIIQAKYPLRLSEINVMDTSSEIQLGNEIKDRIEQTVKEYYQNDCDSDSQYSYRDTYINTIKLDDSLYTVFLVLLKHYPTKAINSKVLFYDNFKKKFIHYEYDFNLHALYEIAMHKQNANTDEDSMAYSMWQLKNKLSTHEFENGKLKPTDLKTDYRINIPEIELVDFDTNGITDYKFTRLLHNGTYNAIQTTIFSLSNNRVDTLLNISE